MHIRRTTTRITRPAVVAHCTRHTAAIIIGRAAKIPRRTRAEVGGWTTASEIGRWRPTIVEVVEGWAIAHRGAACIEASWSVGTRKRASSQKAHCFA